MQEEKKEISEAPRPKRWGVFLVLGLVVGFLIASNPKPDQFLTYYDKWLEEKSTERFGEKLGKYLYVNKAFPPMGQYDRKTGLLFSFYSLKVNETEVVFLGIAGQFIDLKFLRPEDKVNPVDVEIYDPPDLPDAIKKLRDGDK